MLLSSSLYRHVLLLLSLHLLLWMQPCRRRRMTKRDSTGCSERSNRDRIGWCWTLWTCLEKTLWLLSLGALLRSTSGAASLPKGRTSGRGEPQAILVGFPSSSFGLFLFFAFALRFLFWSCQFASGLCLLGSHQMRQDCLHLRLRHRGYQD